VIVVSTLGELRAQRATWAGDVGFVPTMGALHAGHQSLMLKARAECQKVVVSIFVNPTQFGPGEDFEAYPRTEQADLEVCRAAGVDLVWLPLQAELYPPNSQTFVNVEEMGRQWEGASRPHHFRGVATVVCKLFHAVLPTHAYFGQKDRQQLQLVRTMVDDLLFPISVVGVPTARDSLGLALSSRNAYLSPEQREQASAIWRALGRVRAAHGMGGIDAVALEEVFRAGLKDLDGAEVERFDVLLPDFRRAYGGGEVVGDGSVCVAVRYGGVRLLDEIELNG
jgi:pantoate--beta-alanine ligase